MMFSLKRKFTGGQLLEKIFSSLVNKNAYDRIDLPPTEDGDGWCAVIADDSDYHRIRKGYMGYKQLFLSQFQANFWILGLGKACGGYPKDPYCNDIIALDLSEDNLLNGITRKSGNFKNSLIHSASSHLCYDSSLRLVGPWKRFSDKWNPFGEKILNLIEGEFEVTKPSVGDRENLLARLYPMDYKEGDVFYTEKHSRILTDALTEVLSFQKNY